MLPMRYLETVANVLAKAPVAWITTGGGPLVLIVGFTTRQRVLIRQLAAHAADLERAAETQKQTEIALQQAKDAAEGANRAPADAIAAGVGYIPEDRLGTGLAAGMSVAENLIMKAYRGGELASGPFLRRPRVMKRSARSVSSATLTAAPFRRSSRR